MAFLGGAGGSVQQTAGPNDALSITGSNGLVVAFTDEESPEEFETALKRMQSITTYIGGTRIGQDMGPDPDPITIKGQLWDGNVALRVGQLFSLWGSGQYCTFAYLTNKYQILISNFKPKWLHRWRAEYELTFSIIADLAGQYNQSPPQGSDQQVDMISQQTADTLNQMIANDPVGTAAVNAAFQVLFTELEVIGLIQDLAAGDLQNLINIADAAALQAGNYAAGIGGANGNSSQYLLALSAQMGAQLISKNLQNGSAPNVVRVNGGSTPDLFSLASALTAKTGGNPDFAFAIAAANGLTSPLLSMSQVYDLRIPPIPSAA